MKRVVYGSIAFVMIVIGASSCRSRTESTAMASIGGYMSNCYNGNFQVGQVCEDKTVEATASHENNEFIIKGRAVAKYLTADGSRFSVEYSLEITDQNNFYNPEASLPAVVRAVVSKGRSSRTFSATSNALTIARTEGTRNFVMPSKTIELTNAFGSAHVDHFEKIEVLLPGVAGVSTLQF